MRTSGMKYYKRQCVFVLHFHRHVPYSIVLLTCILGCNGSRQMVSKGDADAIREALDIVSRNYGAKINDGQSYAFYEDAFKPLLG
jgi:hypothetical protein